eukprot:COSAG06_NODE_6566_length_2879_cov_1.503237_3_plen_41_part_00
MDTLILPHPAPEFQKLTTPRCVEPTSQALPPEPTVVHSVS